MDRHIQFVQLWSWQDMCYDYRMSSLHLGVGVVFAGEYGMVQFFYAKVEPCLRMATGPSESSTWPMIGHDGCIPGVCRNGRMETVPFHVEISERRRGEHSSAVYVERHTKIAHKIGSPSRVKALLAASTGFQDIAINRQLVAFFVFHPLLAWL